MDGVLGPLLGIAILFSVYALFALLVVLSVYVPLRIVGWVAGTKVANKVSIVVFGLVTLLGVAGMKKGKR